MSGTGGANRGQLAKGLHATYVSRVLRLTLLAPEIVEAILNGRTGPEVTLARLLEPFPVEWIKQPHRRTDRSCVNPPND